MVRMRALAPVTLGLILGGVSWQVHCAPPPGAAYLDGGDSDVGVILCHGRGKHPRWKVVEPLRVGIHRQLGYHTLSLQLPAARRDWKDYAQDFPQAYREIEAGIAYLRDEHHLRTIFLMGHSMGSRMATAFLARHPDAGIAGFIGVGIRNGGGRPLDSLASLREIRIPVLDVYGDGGDGKDARDARARSVLVSARYTQTLIPGADHRFDGHEEVMVEVVVDWLRRQRIAVLRNDGSDPVAAPRRAARDP